MRMTLVRGQADRYATFVDRGDGVRYYVGGIGRKYAIPHDLAHFIVERAFNLTRGFWGSVAAGAVFASMQHVSGRHKPHAAERSRTVLKENAHSIGESEMLVAILTRLAEERHAATSRVARERLKDLLAPPGERERRLPTDQVAKVLAALVDAEREWETSPVDGRIELTWPA